MLLLAGLDIIPKSWQSASKIVKSLLEPKNFDDNSRFFTRSLTLAPRTYSLKETNVNKWLNQGIVFILSVLVGSWANAVKLPSKINIQIVANDVKYSSGHGFVLGVAQLKKERLVREQSIDMGSLRRWVLNSLAGSQRAVAVVFQAQHLELVSSVFQMLLQILLAELVDLRPPIRLGL